MGVILWRARLVVEGKAETAMNGEAAVGREEVPGCLRARAAVVQMCDASA